MARIRNRRPFYISPVVDSVNLPVDYSLVYTSSVLRRVIGPDELVPYLVSEYIPATFIKSFGLAFDPFWKFRCSPIKITPVNRTRTRTIQSVLSARKWVEKRRNSGYSATYSFGNGCVGDFSSSSSNADFNFGLASQPDYLKSVKDTTIRTRPKGSDYGEFESLTVDIYSPTRQISRRFDTLSLAASTCAGWTNRNQTTEVDSTANEGNAGQIPISRVDTWINKERQILATEMSHKALGMLSKVLPERRQYSLVRNLVELRDLPRSIASLRESVSHFRSLTASVPRRDFKKFVSNLNVNVKNIPREYVSYNFGWRQVFSDLVGLLKAPEYITRDVNRLIARRGLPTTFRLRQKYALDSTNSSTNPGPYFDYPTYNVFNGEVNDIWYAQTSHEIEMRMMIQAVFDFPGLAVPEFHRQEWLRKLGITPTFTDLYNLTPWSWLLDWFTGLGNYVDAIESINTDRSTFNFGFLTGIISGKMQTVWGSHNTGTSSVTINPSPTVTSTQTNRFNHTSVMEYRLCVRKDITSAYGAPSLLSPGSLNLYQQSILGSILLDRAGLLNPQRRVKRNVLGI